MCDTRTWGCACGFNNGLTPNRHGLAFGIICKKFFIVNFDMIRVNLVKLCDRRVSGGVTVGYGIKETAIKESQEEASVPPTFLDNLVSAGSVSFFFESERGLFPNTEYVFDLELPIDFKPKCIDGEVQAFELMPITKCLDWICSPKFKTTSTPVVIDFMIRHGIINPENGSGMDLLHCF